jgi:ribonuclease HI
MHSMSAAARIVNAERPLTEAQLTPDIRRAILVSNPPPTVRVPPKPQLHGPGGYVRNAMAARVASDDDAGTVVVYTDGSAIANGTPSAAAGIGVFWGENDIRNVAAPLLGPVQTNQRAEMSAVIRALRDSWLMRGTQATLEIRTDSEYTIKCATVWLATWKKNGFRTANGKPVMNVDLVKEIDTLISGRRVKFTHVRGHSGEPGNESADKLAKAGVALLLEARHAMSVGEPEPPAKRPCPSPSPARPAKFLVPRPPPEPGVRRPAHETHVTPIPRPHEDASRYGSLDDL